MQITIDNIVIKQTDLEFNGRRVSVIEVDGEVYVPLKHILDVAGRVGFSRSRLANLPNEVSSNKVYYRIGVSTHRVYAVKLADVQVVLDEVARRAQAHIKAAETAKADLVRFIEANLESAEVACAEVEGDDQPRVTTVREHLRRVPGKRFTKTTEAVTPEAVIKEANKAEAADNPVEHAANITIERKIQLAGLILREAGFTGMELARMLDGLVVGESGESIIGQCAVVS